MQAEQGVRDGHGRGPRIALAGSSRLEHYPDALVAFIQSQPPNSTIILRRGNKSDPGLFEQVMAKLASMLWMDVEWVRPNPEDGKGATFIRDVDFVTRADVVLCFFDRTEMTGGTAHVVDTASDRETPVYAWGFDGRQFIRIGEHDPDNAWASSVPR